MATYHTYASNDDLREYLAGTSYSSNWTSDTGIISRILEASSKRIDNYIGMRSFGLRSDTRFFDIGSGALRDTRQNYRNNTGTYTLGPSSVLTNSIIFDDWLYSADSVTAYKQTERTESESLSEGYNADYWLLPYNQSPKVQLTLNEDTAKSFHGGQQTLAIAGSWGYSDETSPEKTTTGTIATETETAWGVEDASGLSASQTILVGTEQMYITSISSNTLTVIRGVNGTTATTHTAGTSVYIFVYPAMVIQACLDIAKVYYRDRDLGVTNTIGSGEISITTAQSEQMNILRTLDEYRAYTPDSVVFF